MKKPSKKVWLLLVSFVALASAITIFACGSVQRPDGGEGLLPVGAAAPDLAGRDQTGTEQRLSAERGHPVVVFFYPKDGTPGCTKQACAFRDAWDRYKTAGITVFGVSADSAESHAEFAKEHNLTFPLIADPDLVWAKGFGVSTTLGMTKRVSFLIDGEGKIAKVYPDVDPGVNASEMLKDAESLAR